MNDWVVKNMIKSGVITYEVGNEVVLLKRKQNGYPKYLKDDEVYIIRGIVNDDILVAQHSFDGLGWNQSRKVHKTYLINKSDLRDIKIDSILNNKL